jgi:small-conductance mechanosensitive channel
MIKQRKFHEPQVWLVSFEENRLNFELVVWVSMAIKAFSASREADYVWEIESALRANQIALPIEQKKVYFERRKNSRSMSSIPNSLNPEQFQVTSQKTII